MSKQKPKQKARVVSVTQTINGMVKCSIQMGHAGGVRNNVPVSKPNAKAMWKPETGDTVIVDYTEDGTTYIADVLSVPSKKYEAPTLAEGSMTFQFDDSTEITVDKNESGKYMVDITASGTVSVSASQSVQVDASTVDLDSTGNASEINLGPSGDTVVTDITTNEDSDGHITDITLIKTTKTKAE